MIQLKEKQSNVIFFIFVLCFLMSCNTIENKKADKSYISYQYYDNGEKKQQTLISPNGKDTVHVIRYSKSGFVKFDKGAGFSLVFKKSDKVLKLNITSINLEETIKNGVFFDSKRNLLKTYYIDSCSFEISLTESLIESWKVQSKNEEIQFCLAWFNNEGTLLVKEKCVKTTFNHLLSILSDNPTH